MESVQSHQQLLHLYDFNAEVSTNVLKGNVQEARDARSLLQKVFDFVFRKRPENIEKASNILCPDRVVCNNEKELIQKIDDFYCLKACLPANLRGGFQFGLSNSGAKVKFTIWVKPNTDLGLMAGYFPGCKDELFVEPKEFNPELVQMMAPMYRKAEETHNRHVAVSNPREESYELTNPQLPRQLNIYFQAFMNLQSRVECMGPAIAEHEDVKALMEHKIDVLCEVAYRKINKIDPSCFESPKELKYAFYNKLGGYRAIMRSFSFL